MFIHSSIDDNLHCFPFLWWITLLWKFEYNVFCVWACVFITWGIHLGVKFLDEIVTLCLFNVGGMIRLFFKVAIPFHILITIVVFSASPLSCQYLIFFTYSHPSGYGMVFCCGFHLFSLMTTDVEYFFMCLLGFCLFYLEKYLYKFLSDLNQAKQRSWKHRYRKY